MKKRMATVLGVLIALLVIWQSLGNLDTNTSGADRSIEAPSPASIPHEVVVETASEGVSDRPIADLQPIPEPDRVPETCAELERRRELEPNGRLIFAEGLEIGERECGLALQLISGATAQALPGLPGFEVMDTGGFAFHPRAILFDEADVPEWSRPMEGQIYDETRALIDFPLVTLHAVCRASTCGLVIAYSSASHDGGNYNYYARQLADNLGFRGYYGGTRWPPNGVSYTTIYLGDWETKRPDEDAPIKDAPRSFEEALEKSDIGSGIE